MAPIRLEINEIAWWKMIEEIAGVVEKYADSVLEWKGELGFVAEIGDTPVIKQAMNPIKKEITVMLNKARQKAILYKEKKPRKMIIERSKK